MRYFYFLSVSLLILIISCDRYYPDYPPEFCNIYWPGNDGAYQIGAIIPIDVSCYYTNPDYPGRVGRVDLFLNDSLLVSKDNLLKFKYLFNTAGLQPGSYLLKLIGQGNGGLTSMDTLTLHLFAAPPGMIFVKGRSYYMNHNAGESSWHQVVLDSFYIGQREVTLAEWHTVMGADWVASGLNADLPVTSISWYDALIYCNKRSIAEGVTPCYKINGYTDPADWGEVPSTVSTVWDQAVFDREAKGYRLPTETEWHIAAFGAQHCSIGYKYAGSDTLNLCGWYIGNSDNVVHAGSKKRCNALDIYDMSGNAAEWCWDWYAEYSGSYQINPVGPSSGSKRINRGGGYLSRESDCLIYTRNAWEPFKRIETAGLRVVRNY